MTLVNVADRRERRVAGGGRTGAASGGRALTSGDSVARSRVARAAWFGLGWLAVGIGGVGIVVPGLPTTGFMILAAACFARSSPRFEQWVLHLPGIGRSVMNYRSGLGMPRRAKVTAVSMMGVAIAISAGLVLDNNALRLGIVAAGVIGTWYIIRRVPTSPAATAAPSTGITSDAAS